MALVPPDPNIQPIEKLTPWYRRWYTLTGGAVIVVGVVVGAVAGIAVAAQGSGEPPTTWDLGWIPGTGTFDPNVPGASPR